MPIKPVYDRERLARVLRDQFGVLSRSQALECGLSRGAVDHLIQPDGRWQRIVPGVYATMTGPLAPEQREMAALLHAGPHSLITGAAAVRRHRLQCAGLNEVDVLVPNDVRVLSTDFIRIMRTARMPDKCFTTRQLRFVTLDRAVADAARRMKRLSDVRAVVAEAVQRGRCDIPPLIRELNEGASTGSRFYRTVLLEIAVGVRSSAESDFMVLISKSDLEPPMYNARLYATDGTFLGIADAWWQRACVAAEVDSREYHLRPADYEQTTSRHNRMAAYGITMLHFLPSTVKHKGPAVVADLRRAVECGNQQPPRRITAIPAGAEPAGVRSCGTPP